MGHRDHDCCNHGHAEMEKSDEHADTHNHEHGVPSGIFGWNELLTSNADLCEKFYNELFGWTTIEHPMGDAGKYLVFQHDGVEIASVFELKGAKLAGVSPQWLSYISVANVDESTVRAQSLGAKVIAAPADIPRVGRLSVISDPGGATLALFSPAQHEHAHTHEHGEGCQH